ncbi:hypothetical protein SALCHL_002462 [Streptomyces albus subsp. chlorinus]|uniref:hypothetical protein n=1 Tax=Streptomyces albus TaxID=1888 RepID=UPI00156F61A6|nr:hypothetical protein [Streptomyces albus]
MGAHASKKPPYIRCTWPTSSSPCAGEPVPVPGCDVCELLARDRERARRHGHLLIVRSCNAVMAGHPHRREGTER